MTTDKGIAHGSAGGFVSSDEPAAHAIVGVQGGGHDVVVTDQVDVRFLGDVEIGIDVQLLGVGIELGFAGEGDARNGAIAAQAFQAGAGARL